MVRLARPDERVRWDALMDHHHYLGFKRFAGRTCATWRNGAASGWRWPAGRPAPSSVLRGTADRLAPQEMFPRLHLITNNTRFLVLSKHRVFPNLASSFMSAMLRRLSDDWQHAYGHPLLAAELRRPDAVRGDDV